MENTSIRTKDFARVSRSDGIEIQQIWEYISVRGSVPEDWRSVGYFKTRTAGD